LEKFLDTLTAGFVSHAYIFTGSDEDTYKQAKLFARTVNCENPGLAPCGFCTNCRKISSGTHPDVTEIFADGASIRIDQVRSLIRIFAEMPMEASRRVCVIHEAHRMTQEAQNALLKTLEDPVTQSTVVLLTDNIKQLLPTIVSRCQIMDFGSETGEALLDAETRRMMADMVLRMVKDPGMEQGSMARQITESGQEPERLLDFLASLYRDILAVKTKSGADLINGDLAGIIGQCAAQVNARSAVKALDSVFYQARAARSRGNQNLIWYNLLLELREVV